MSKYVKIAIVILLGAGLIWAGNFYWKNLRGVGPVLRPSPKDIADISFNTTGLPLSLPPGFSISIFAKDLSGARVMALGSGGMWVSQTSEGKISFLEIKDGKVIGQRVVLENLRKPHGLAIWCLPEAKTNPDACQLYIAEEDKISRAQISYLTPALSDPPAGRAGIGEGERVRLGALRKIIDLPFGGGHFTRTIRFGPDDRLYVSIGSSCNVCIEKDARRAAIYSMNRDGSDFKSYATGLRNAVFFDWSFVDGLMWATEMGRDLLGDDLPPDELNLVIEGGDHGWPNCYGQRIFDDKFNGDGSCHDTIPSEIDLPAHSAPLGLAFVPEEAPPPSSPPEGGSDGTGYSWPDEYQGDLLVAYHGSWNRSQPTGYKIVRIKLDEFGMHEGTEDFITGWLTKEGALGRPVDILIQPGGTMYISDDKAGVIYKVAHQGKDSEDLIHVDAPAPNSIIKSPLVVRGEARGNWFFEASFPIKLLDANGNQIAISHAQAQGQWMTEDFVPFEGKLEFTSPATDTGILVLEKDNPSGLPELAAEIRIRVRFKP